MSNSNRSAKEILQKTFGHLDTVVREKGKKKKKRKDQEPISTTDDSRKEKTADCQSSG